MSGVRCEFPGPEPDGDAELALAWVLSHPEVALALTGFDAVEHVDANVGAADWQLSAEERAEVDAITDWWEGRGAVIDSGGL